MADQRNWLIGIIFGPMFVAAVLAYQIGYSVGFSGLRRPAPGPKWSFDSWATNFTAVAAAVGAVLGASSLPDHSKPVGNSTFTALSLFFGLFVVAGPFVFQCLRRPPRTAADLSAPGYGFNFTLLLACSVTFAAVIGELVTLALLYWELLDGGTWGRVVLGAVSAVGLLASYYYVVTVRILAGTDWGEHRARLIQRRSDELAAQGVPGERQIAVIDSSAVAGAGWNLL